MGKSHLQRRQGVRHRSVDSYLLQSDAKVQLLRSIQTPWRWSLVWPRPDQRRTTVPGCQRFVATPDCEGSSRLKRVAQRSLVLFAYPILAHQRLLDGRRHGFVV